MTLLFIFTTLKDSTGGGGPPSFDCIIILIVSLVDKVQVFTRKDLLDCGPSPFWTA